MAGDSTLNSLWRNAVLVKCGYRCVLCGCSGTLQAHHIVFRRKAYLKHDTKNGVALCSVCHRIAHTKSGEDRVRKYIGEEDWQYLCVYENVILKDHLIKSGITRKEFSDLRAKELKEFLMEA